MENIVKEEEKRRGRKMFKMGVGKRTCYLCHSPLCDIPGQIVKLLPDRRQNKNHERRHACVTTRTDLN